MNMADGASSSSSSIPPKNYDVFISFRGEDTRNNFTSHLYAALCRKQIKAYIDENDLKRGDEISPALLKAIRGSKFFVIVLSKQYACSTWCLDELQHILQCKGKDRQEILPIFYNVDPSHVRKQKESYATAFIELEKRFEDRMDKVKAWRDALTEVGGLSGWAYSSQDGSESKLVEAVVEEIIKKLNHTSSSNNLKGLVGVDERINQIGSLLRIGSLDVRIIGIWGMGGIGKTTLARAVFNRFSSQFEACSFLANVREESEKHGMPYLEKKLFSELLEEENVNPVKWPFLKDRLRRKKVLIVFDDIDDPEQLEQLFGDWFGLESRIIVTSRDRQVLKNIEVHGIYRLGELCHDKALQLFYMHAFKRNAPTEDEIGLAKRVVNYTRGLPLALKVLGCHLYCKSKVEWESALDKLQEFPNKKIHTVLRISYDALDDTEKDIFLDIACFFKGENKELVENILNGCGFHATIGIKVLIDKSLISLEEIPFHYKLGMHDLIQDMGREIVRVQSREEPRKCSRLWRADDILHSLKYNIGIEAMEGISLDTTNVNEEVHLSPMTFSKMYRLRLLIISNGRKVSLSQGPPPFPDTLRYLSWPAYPLKSLSTGFTAKKLVQLNLRCSKLERLWDGVVHLENLKGINLTGSRHLTQLPDLSLAPNIESIDLKFCDRLIEVPSSFQHLGKLKDLYLIGCSSLSNISRLPNNLCRLNVFTSTFCETTDCNHGYGPPIKRVKCLEYPNHDRKFEICSKLEKFPEILEPLRSLGNIKLDYTAIKELPLSIEHLIGLRCLSVRYCENLAFLPNTIHKLESLKELRLGHCRNLKSLPELPLYLSILEANGCTSLETVSSTSTTSLTQSWNHSWNICLENEFLFLDCRKLNENARKNLMDKAQFRIFNFAMMYSKKRKMNVDSHGTNHVLEDGRFQFGCPGSEIPRWINHQSEGSSISINFPPRVDQWFNKTYLGLAICLVLEKDDYSTNLDHSDWTSFSYECLYTYPNGDSLTVKGYAFSNWCREDLYSFCPHRNQTKDFTDRIKADAIDLNCEHVLLYFDGCFGDYLYMMKEKYESNESGFTSTTTATASFSFKPQKTPFSFKPQKIPFSLKPLFSFKPNTDEVKVKKCAVHHLYDQEVKVKKCGVHLLYAHEADKFGFVQPYDWEGRLSAIRLKYEIC